MPNVNPPKPWSPIYDSNGGTSNGSGGGDGLYHFIIASMVLIFGGLGLAYLNLYPGPTIAILATAAIGGGTIAAQQAGIFKDTARWYKENPKQVSFLKQTLGGIAIAAGLIFSGASALSAGWSLSANRRAELPFETQGNIPAANLANPQAQNAPQEVSVVQEPDGQCQFSPAEIEVTDGTKVTFISSTNTPMNLRYKQDVWGFLPDNTFSYPSMDNPTMTFHFGDQTRGNNTPPTIQCSTQDLHNHPDEYNQSLTDSVIAGPTLENSTLTINPMAAMYGP